MNTERGFGVLEANRSALHFKYYSVEEDMVLDEFVVCAVRGCRAAPPVEREWDQRSEAERGAVDEQHIAPPPSPPMPPLNLLPMDSVQPSAMYYGPGQAQYSPSSREALDNFLAASNPAASRQEPLPAAGDSSARVGGQSQPKPAAASASGGASSGGLVAGVVVLCLAIILGVVGGVGIAILRQRKAAAASEDAAPQFELNPRPNLPPPPATAAGDLASSVARSPVHSGARLSISTAPMQASSRAHASLQVAGSPLPSHRQSVASTGVL